MDRYLLNQIDERAVRNWNQFVGQTVASPAELISQLRARPESREIRYSDAVESGHLVFYTSGTTGSTRSFRVSRASLLHPGLSQKLDQLYSVRNHRLRNGLVALPMAGNPMGMKYCFALEGLGLDVIPAGVHTHNFALSRVVDVLIEQRVEFLVARALEAELYARVANTRTGRPLEDVLALLVTGEVVGPSRLRRLEALYPNAVIRSVYGLTELNSGLFSCSRGCYHFANNGQTIVELVGSSIEERANIAFTVLRPELQCIRYDTRDVGQFVRNCECEHGGCAFTVIGRAHDEIVPGLFLSDISERLSEEIGPHNLFASRSGTGFKILVKAETEVQPDFLRELTELHRSLEIVTRRYQDTGSVMPLAKSCTVSHSLEDAYEL